MLLPVSLFIVYELLTLYILFMIVPSFQQKIDVYSLQEAGQNAPGNGHPCIFQAKPGHELGSI